MSILFFLQTLFCYPSSPFFRNTAKVAHHFYLSFFGNFESLGRRREIRSFRRMTNKNLFFGVRLFPFGVFSVNPCSVGRAIERGLTEKTDWIILDIILICHSDRREESCTLRNEVRGDKFRHFCNRTIMKIKSE